ncbi:unnamed protein product [Cylicocyclus nassatus]|uniref:DUF7774 domain-containing protein n=1 Tax=Cylicocyclus nassatus TaxID=53992 RepID=A0AA36H5K5_CYLNA|nr:unnamed protein product [Cylicocyclus nassatus]
MLLSSGSVVAAQPKKAMNVLNRRRRAVVRHLFQEIGRRQKEKPTIQEIYGNVSEIKPETATVFEKTDAPFSPAVVHEPPHILRWKDGVKASTEGRFATSTRREKLLQFGSEIDAEADTAIKKLQRTNDFRIASHIMRDVKKENILETALSKQKNDVLRQFFEKGLQDPTMEIMDALREAMETCFKTYCNHLAQKDQNHIDQEKKEFLKDEEKAKQVMLDVLLRCSEYLPTVWGGTHCGDAVIEVLPSDSEMTQSGRTETDVDALIKNMDNDKELKKIESDSDYDVEIKKALALLGLDKTCKTVITRLSSRKHNKTKTTQSTPTAKRSKEQVRNEQVKVDEFRKNSGERQEKSEFKKLRSKIISQGQKVTNKAAITGAYFRKINERSREVIKAPKPSK